MSGEDAGVLLFRVSRKKYARAGATTDLVVAGGRAPMLIGFGPDGVLRGVLTGV